MRHDLAGRGRGNIDHLAVGPTGVYLIDSKNLSGLAKVERGLLTVELDSLGDRYSFHRLARWLLESAKDVEERISADLKWRPHVRPVVAIWGSFPQSEVQADGIAYVAAEKLVGWLAGRKVQLCEADRVAIASVIANLPLAEAGVGSDRRAARAASSQGRTDLA